MIKKAKFDFPPLTKGGDYEVSARFYQTSGDPWDMTGCIYAASCRTQPLKTADLLFDFDLESSEPASGILRFRVDKALTADLAHTGWGYYDLKITGTDGQAFYWISGKIMIEDGVS